jgi:tetratricopeptide (TPR) repeat protein
MGLSELQWELAQQTDVLKSIDEKLENPSQTQAKEWREMGETLRHRGDLTKAEKFFTKSLEESPIDYRTYVGLAETYLKMERFDDARKKLEESFIHAPKPSLLLYSARRIAHIDACSDDFESAFDTINIPLSKIREVSDKRLTEVNYQYGNALYDRAQYAARTNRMGVCLASLEKSIKYDASYFYLAEYEKNFEPMREVVDLTLRKIKDAAKNKLSSVLSAIEPNIPDVDEVVGHATKLFNRYYSSNSLHKSISKCGLEAIIKTFTGAKKLLIFNDYLDIKDAQPFAETAHGLLEATRICADMEIICYKEADEAYRDEQTGKAMLSGIFCGVVGYVTGFIGGGVHGFFTGFGKDNFWDIMSGSASNGGIYLGIGGAILGGLIGSAGITREFPYKLDKPSTDLNKKVEELKNSYSQRF